MITRPDPEALLVALVLCPGTYSRNRFFSLYTDPAFAYVRRRAQLVRSVITELTQPDVARRGQILSVVHDEPGETSDKLTYVVPSLGLRRTTALSTLELSLVRYALERRLGMKAPDDEDTSAKARIEDALQRLAPDLAFASLATAEPEDTEGDLGDDEPHPARQEIAGNSPLPEGEPER